MSENSTEFANYLLNEHQAAEYLNLSVRSLQAWRVRGCGPRYSKIGRSVRYRLCDLDAFVADNLTPSTSATTGR